MGVNSYDKRLHEHAIPLGIVAKQPQTTAKATFAATRQAASNGGNRVRLAEQAMRSKIDHFTSVLR